MGGASIDTRPIQKAGVGSGLLPRASLAFAYSAPQAPPPLPDHYAMDTPEGRVEAGELASRGLYAQQRFAWRTAQAEVLVPEPPLGPAPAALEPLRAEAGIETTLAGAPSGAEVTPRSVDVGAELAAAG
ncbi:MAG: hypothetical protein ACEQR8_02120 [Cypionkella sp.]